MSDFAEKNAKVLNLQAEERDKAEAFFFFSFRQLQRPIRMSAKDTYKYFVILFTYSIPSQDEMAAIDVSLCPST